MELLIGPNCQIPRLCVKQSHEFGSGQRRNEEDEDMGEDVTLTLFKRRKLYVQTYLHRSSHWTDRRKNDRTQEPEQMSSDIGVTRPVRSEITTQQY